MQFKLLNIHKFVGNFATTLVGTFIPLIISKHNDLLLILEIELELLWLITKSYFSFK